MAAAPPPADEPGSAEVARRSLSRRISQPFLLDQRRRRRGLFIPRLNLQDTETLLNALMLLSTFLLAFSAGTLIEYSYDDFLDIDTRAIDAVVVGEDSEVNLTGSVVLRGFLLATTLLMIALSIGVGCYLSLSLSYCRENAALFYRWSLVHQFIILGGYFCFVCGAISYVISIRVLLEAVFPAWCTSRDAVKDVDLSLYTFLSPLDFVYNDTSGDVVLLDGSETLVNDDGQGEFDKYKYKFKDRNCWAVNKNIASYYKRHMVAWMIVLILAIFIVGIFVQEWPRVSLWLAKRMSGQSTMEIINNRSRRTTKFIFSSLTKTRTNLSPRAGQPTTELSPADIRRLELECALRATDEDLMFEIAELDLDDLITMSDEVLYLDQTLKDAGIRIPGRRLKLIRKLRETAGLETSTPTANTPNHSAVLPGTKIALERLRSSDSVRERGFSASQQLFDQAPNPSSSADVNPANASESGNLEPGE